MDKNALHTALGTAYGLDQVDRDRAAAVRYLREAFASDEARKAAQDHHYELREIVAARTVGERCGCHVSKVTHDLLTEALTQPPTAD